VLEGVATLAELKSGAWSAVDVERAHIALDYKAAADLLTQREAERRAKLEAEP
jgi:hypothetical protein